MIASIVVQVLVVQVLAATWALERQGGSLLVRLADAQDVSELTGVFRVWGAASRSLEELGLVLPQTTLEASSSAADFARRTGEPAFIAAQTRGVVIRTQRLRALAAQGLLETTLWHEAFHRAQPAGLPRWLAEGLARVFSGEFIGDVPRTGLEGVSASQLDALLEGRTSSAKLRSAYAEASRRANRLLASKGWSGVLRTRSP